MPNIVFLFDLNSFPPGNDLEVQHKYLKWVQEHILTLVSKAATDEASNDVDYSKIMWSFKFYNSAKDVDYRNKKFEPFTIASFEGFEACLLEEYDKFRSCPSNQDCADLNRSSCLSQALMRITSDLRWDENAGKKLKTENIVYAILRVPRDEDELLQFADTHDDIPSSPNSKFVLSALLPSAFCKAFHSKNHIQLNFIDTWVLFKQENLEKEWNGQDYSKHIVKVLDFLDKGSVGQLQKSQPGPPGLPSYFMLLKNSLRQATSVSPTTTEKLSQAQKLLQSSRKEDSNSSKLDSSYNSLPGMVTSAKIRDRRRKVEHKENRKRVVACHRRSYAGLQLPFHEKTSPDSSTSEDMGSSIFGNGQEQALNRYVQELNARKSRYPNGKVCKQRPSSRLLHPPSSAPQQKYRRSPPRSGRDSESVISGTNPFSRAHQLLTKATEKEWKKWSIAINKEEEERRVMRDERRKFLSNLESSLFTMKTRLNMWLEKSELKDIQDMEKLLPVIKDFQSTCLADENLCLLSLSQTIVQFVIEKLHASNMHGEATRKFIEKEIYTPIPILRGQVMKVKNDEKELNKIFRECQLQILIRMEASWLVPDAVGDNAEILRDEIIDLLSLLNMYIKKPVDDFMANILVLGYMETHSEMLMRLYRGLNADAPSNLILCVTPSKSIRSRASIPPSSIMSPFGSMESVFLPPSQVTGRVKAKDLLKREESFASQKSSARYASHVYVNNPKKTIMVPVRNVKKFSTVPKSPKPAGRSARVRRNLFDSDGSKRKGSIHGSITRFSRSPSVAGKSQSSLLSPRVRSLRSKRKLNLDDEDEGGRKYSNNNVASPDLFSPSRDSDILCPATPSEKAYNVCKKMKRSSSHKSDKTSCVAESPELPKSGTVRSFSQAVHSLSFYSTGSENFKSRAWEKSGHKMMAAKIKRQIDSSTFMNTGLTYSDLEIMGGASSPESKSVDHNFQSPTSRPRKTLKEDNSPCCSKSLLRETLSNVEVVQANVNPNIEALIRSEQSMSMLKTTPKGTGGNATPKKISFNFDERLVKTPNRNCPGTPKSILKTPNRDDGSVKKSSNETDRTPEKPTHFQAVSNSPPSVPSSNLAEPEKEAIVPASVELAQPQVVENGVGAPAESIFIPLGEHPPLLANSEPEPLLVNSEHAPNLVGRGTAETQAGSFLELLDFPNNPEFDDHILQYDPDYMNPFVPTGPYIRNVSMCRVELPPHTQYGSVGTGDETSKVLSKDPQQPVESLADL